MWVDTTAMMGAETGARAGVGTWTGEGREAETGIGTELGLAAAAGASWGTALIGTGDKAGGGAVGCTWTVVELKPGGELKACD